MASSSFSRRQALAISGGVALSGIFPGIAQAQVDCAAYEELLISSVLNSLWGTMGETSSQRYLYVLGAPWCPYCRKVVNEYAGQDSGVQMRFIPIDGVQPRHRRQQVDIILNNEEGLRRTFMGTGEPADYDPRLLKLVHDANQISARTIIDRFPYNFASPSFLFGTNEGYVPAVGLIDVSEVLDDIEPQTLTSDDRRAELEDIIVAEKPLPRGTQLIPDHDATQHFALPFPLAASSKCHTRDVAFDAVSEVEIGGTTWIKASVAEITATHEVINAYFVSSFVRLI